MGKKLYDRLEWLEEELREEDTSAGLPECDQDFDLDDILAEFQEEPELPQRRSSANRAVDFSRTAFGDEDFDESTAVLVERRRKKQKPRNAAEKKAAKPKKTGIKGLVILAILEVLAILALLLRWALWFL